MLHGSQRRTKVICTIGPSSQSLEVMRGLLTEGMNIARLNMSHGTHEYHAETCALLRQAANETGKNLGIMMDLQGPKIRTGNLVDGQTVHLKVGAPFCITTEEVEGTEEKVSTTYKPLPLDVHSGDAIFMADGVLELEVTSVTDTDVQCIVVHGGHLGEHKGINLPGVDVSSPAMTPKDVTDLEFGIENLDIDFVALSFVRNAEDIVDLKRRIAKTEKKLSVVAKIERPEAIKNFSDILDVTDVVMIARGDLGVEVPLNEVPQIQKRLISECNDMGVPVITATQMLESMISSARPTRAEVADVANAIYDGTDAVMLSGETASGQFPVRTAEVMSQIAQDADISLSEEPSHNRILRMRESGIRQGKGSYGDAIGQAVCRTAHAIGATRIICFTKLGFTAALIARYRPSVPITAVTREENIQHRCSIIWGVDSIMTAESPKMETLDDLVDRILLENKLADPGDTVVIAGGVPFAIRTRTNMMKLHTVGGSL
ncbi:MAG: pyruvate kinase [Candidatus Hydrogenedentota bacterium]